MEISPAAGKILGMLMAYAVSALGLVLAYYNYRKRIIKADPVFSNTAKAVVGGVVLVLVIAVILMATVAGHPGKSPGEAIAKDLWGLILPAAIVLVSIWLTWRLYRHFVRRLGERRDR